MGTNFYLSHKFAEACTEDDPIWHIGKRSAAGMFCWDCGITLCEEGPGKIHSGRGNWFDSCPRCGKAKEKETLDRSAPGRELGFNTGLPQKKCGVKSCSSFTWAMSPKNIESLKPRQRGIEDEYGRKYTLLQFKKILEECPIQFHDSIGMEFS